MTFLRNVLLEFPLYTTARVQSVHKTICQHQDHATKNLYLRQFLNAPRKCRFVSYLRKRQIDIYEGRSKSS